MKRTIHTNGTILSEDEAIECSECNALEISDKSVDFYILKIIVFTINEARTVKEISQALSIPLVKAYELVDWMKDQGILIELGKVRTALHGKASSYISTVKSGTISLENNRLIFRCQHKDGSVKARICEVGAESTEKNDDESFC